MKVVGLLRYETFHDPFIHNDPAKFGGESVTEAVAEAGISYAKQSAKFEYNSLDGKLSGCESVTYFDEESSMVAFACLCGTGCEEEEGAYEGGVGQYASDGEEDSIEHEDEYDLEDSPDMTLYQFDQDAARLREFIVDDKERARVAATRLGREVDDHAKMRMVRMAIATVRTIYDKVDSL